jgi:hypothetical protein
MRGLQIGPHDVRHAADLRISPKLVCRGLALPQAVSQGFNGHIEPNLVPVLEAVSHRLGRVVNSDRHAFDRVFLNAGSQGVAGESHDSERESVRLGASSLGLNRQPDFLGEFRGYQVEAKSRQQTDDAVWHALGGFGKAVVLGDDAVLCRKESTPQTFEKAKMIKSPEVVCGNSESLEVFGTDNSHPAGKFQHTVCLGVFHVRSARNETSEDVNGFRRFTRPRDACQAAGERQGWMEPDGIRPSVTLAQSLRTLLLAGLPPEKWLTKVAPAATIAMFDACASCVGRSYGESSLIDEGVITVKEENGFDPYKVLQVSHDASLEVIKAAYQNLARDYHPDRGGIGDAEYLKLLNRAKDILLDMKKKAAFDVIYKARVRASRPRPW